MPTPPATRQPDLFRDAPAVAPETWAARLGFGDGWREEARRAHERAIDFWGQFFRARRAGHSKKGERSRPSQERGRGAENHLFARRAPTFEEGR